MINKLFPLFLLLFGTSLLAWPSDLPPKPEVTLTAASATKANLYMGLGKKWKTYSEKSTNGIPPVFDWSRSVNVKRVKVYFPKPQRLSLLGVSFLGYRDYLRLPIEVEPKDPTKAIRLNLKLQYAICDKVCVPLEESFKLTLPPKSKI